jgi:glycosyltransferase involved in cell wall biosynthesis
MAMGKAVVSTTIGAEGLPVVHDRHLLIADQPQGFADAVVRLLEDPSCRYRLGRAARELVATRFDWAVVASELETALLDAAHSLEKQGTAA